MTVRRFFFHIASVRTARAAAVAALALVPQEEHRRSRKPKHDERNDQDFKPIHSSKLTP